MDQWAHLLHELATTIGAVAAAIAAISSLRNHRILRNGVQKPPDVSRPKKNGRKHPEDWYKAPDL